MNQDAKSLKQFIIIFKSIKQMESAYIELEEVGVPYDYSEFFDDFLELATNINKTIKIENLSESQLNKYCQLNIDIFERLKLDYPQLCQISGNIEGIFYNAYYAAEKSIEKALEPYKNVKNPVFLCGFSSFNLFIPESSFLGLLLKMTDIGELFTYKNGKLDINSGNFTVKFNLTSQEYQIYGEAYKVCMDILNKELNLNGTTSSAID